MDKPFVKKFMLQLHHGWRVSNPNITTWELLVLILIYKYIPRFVQSRGVISYSRLFPSEISFRFQKAIFPCVHGRMQRNIFKQ